MLDASSQSGLYRILAFPAGMLCCACGVVLRLDGSCAGPHLMICLASDSSVVLLLSSAPVTLSSALRAFVWSVGTMRREEPLLDEDAREPAEFWERGGATRSMFALFSASLSFPVATYISTDSWIKQGTMLVMQSYHWLSTVHSIHAWGPDTKDVSKCED